MLYIAQEMVAQESVAQGMVARAKSVITQAGGVPGQLVLYGSGTAAEQVRVCLLVLQTFGFVCTASLGHARVFRKGMVTPAANANFPCKLLAPLACVPGFRRIGAKPQCPASGCAWASGQPRPQPSIR